MLPYPDQFHLQAAEGWLELGNAAEAALDLAQISQENRSHPDALQVQWQIHAKEKQWNEAAKIAQSITLLVPEWAFGWIHHAYALHELGQTRQAYDLLSPVLPRFPKDWLMRYNLACYACQMGQLDEARNWLKKACALGDKAEIQAMAKEDRDLAPLNSKSSPPAIL